MSAPALVAVDVSYSTSGSPTYWDTVVSAVVRAAPADAELVAWNDHAQQVPRHMMDRYVAQRSGSGGTQVSSLARLLRASGFKGDLHVITDGQVLHRDVVEADGILDGAAFNSVNVHIVQLPGHPCFNLSVSAPFVRASRFCIHTGDNDTVAGDARSPLDLRGIATVADFLAKYDDIYATMLAQNMGRSSLAMKADVLQMRTRLARDAERWDAADDWGVPQISRDLDDGSWERAREGVERIIAAFEVDSTTELNARVDKLLRLCASEGSYDMALLDRTCIAQRTAAAAHVDAEPPPPEQAAFGHECPLLMTGSLPVLLVAAPAAPLLEGLDKKGLDDIAANPLNVLRHRDIVDKLLECLDTVVGHDFYREAFVERASELVSPFTRRPLLGGLFFGNDGTSVDATSWTLAHLTTGGKLLGNRHLWYVALWSVLRSSPRWKDDAALVDNADAHLAYRAREGTAKLALSGLPGSVQVIVPLRVALWYVVNSADWYAERDVRHDRLRELWPHADVLCAALDALRLDYPAQYIARRVRHLRLWSVLMKDKDALPAWSDAVRAQHQNHVRFDDGSLVFLDGPPAGGAPELPEAARGLPLEDVLGIVRLARANVQNKAGAVVVPRDPSARVPAPVFNYNDAENDRDKQRAHGVRVCPATLRPFYRVADATWLEASVALWGPLQGQLSMYALYARYVASRGALPDDDWPAFAKYCAAAQAGRATSPKDTLPAAADIIFRGLVDGYAEAYRDPRWTGRSAAAVAAVLQESAPISRRVQMEAAA